MKGHIYIGENEFIKDLWVQILALPCISLIVVIKKIQQKFLCEIETTP